MIDLALEVDGRLYRGWKRIAVRRGIEQLAGEFDLEASDQWALKAQPSPVLPGQSARVLINGQVVITGFVDDVAMRYDAADHGISFRGRDRSGDLVDCSARVDGQSWAGRSLAQIAADLCQPFGVPVSVQGSTGAAFAEQAINPGETVHELLARAAQLRGLLVIADGQGGIRLTGEGSARASAVLALGTNLLAGNRLESHADRFALYRVIGQSSADDQQVLAEARDAGVRATRVTTVAASDGVTPGDARRLADWTRGLRLARATRAELVVRGWLDVDRPWQPNTVVEVRDPYLRLLGDYLIAEVLHTLDEREGAVTALTVVPLGAYAPAPVIEVAA